MIGRVRISTIYQTIPQLNNNKKDLSYSSLPQYPRPCPTLNMMACRSMAAQGGVQIVTDTRHGCLPVINKQLNDGVEQL